MDCPECGEELEFLDTIIKKATGEIMWELFTCHNEECSEHGAIYNDEGTLGDPSGHY